MYFTVLFAIFIILLRIVTSEGPACQIPIVDPFDPQTAENAQLEMIRCLMKMNNYNTKLVTDAILQVHNGSFNINSKILEHIIKLEQKTNFNYTINDVIIYCVLTIVVTYIVKKISSVLLYLAIMKSDSFGGTLAAVANLRSWFYPSQAQVTLESYRSSRPVPTLLVILRCCCPKGPTSNV